MTQFNIFIIRAVIGAVFAVVLTRMFYGKVEIVYVAGLAVFLVGMAYVMEYFRKKRKDSWISPQSRKGRKDFIFFASLKRMIKNSNQEVF